VGKDQAGSSSVKSVRLGSRRLWRKRNIEEIGF